MSMQNMQSGKGKYYSTVDRFSYPRYSKEFIFLNIIIKSPKIRVQAISM